MLRDQDLQNLLRMALESEALRGDVGQRPGLLRLTPRRPRIRFHWAAAAIAAGICALLARTPFGSIQNAPRGPHRTVALGNGLQVDVCAIGNGSQAAQVERSTAGASDDVTQIMALMRTWSEGCQCLTWDVYEWTTGRTLAAVGGPRPLHIPLDTQGDPPIDQWLILATASGRVKLPQSRADADDLLDCLDQQVAPTQVELSSTDYTRVVHACLPAEVGVISKSFCSD